ncbi:MAG: S-layer homology domain-containing protein [Candidatus Ornithomonoglobus sp.]
MKKKFIAIITAAAMAAGTATAFAAPQQAGNSHGDQQQEQRRQEPRQTRETQEQEKQPQEPRATREPQEQERQGQEPRATREPQEREKQSERENGEKLGDKLEEGAKKLGEKIAEGAKELGQKLSGRTKVQFNDVKDTDWFRPYVDYVAERGIMQGRNDNFEPSTVTTRAEYILALYRAAGSPEVDLGDIDFSDIDISSEYAQAIAWAVENGITDGYDDGTFLPNGSLTREMAMTFLYRALGALGIDFSETSEDALSKFSDKGKISSWAQKGMNALVKLGIIEGGDDGGVDPQGELKNSEVAAMIYRILNKTAATAEPTAVPAATEAAAEEPTATPETTEAAAEEPTAAPEATETAAAAEPTAAPEATETAAEPSAEPEATAAE